MHHLEIFLFLMLILIMSRLNHLHNAEKNTNRLTSTSDMGDNVLKARPSIQWSVSSIYVMQGIIWKAPKFLQT